MLFLIDASRANNEQKTGVEWYAYFVIQELKKIIPDSWQVKLYTREKLKGELGQIPSNWEERVLTWPPKRLWTQIRLSYEIYKLKQNNPLEDIILFVPAHVLPLVCPAKTIITIHDLGGVRFPGGYSFFERFYTYFSTWWALKKGVVLVPSHFVLQELSYSFKTIDDQKKTEIAQQYGLSRPYFFSIGRLEEKKNTIGIIRAFNILKKQITLPLQLVLLGKPGWGFANVEKEITASPFAKDIILPGWVAQKDVPALMAGAQGLLLPSFYEGFGIPILEAFAVCTPVITSNLASMPEVASGAAILVNPFKPQEISLAMEHLLEKEDLRQKLIKRGFLRSKEFTWQKTAQAIFEVAAGMKK
ncbi:MAG: glycosyltransferase family 1 protein [Candidatus Magasanikbacteria bacterium]|nr:glycosyltransferase family 1 protein [Candidatus Magasanikbacteria bacterium]